MINMRNRMAPRQTLTPFLCTYPPEMQYSQWFEPLVLSATLTCMLIIIIITWFLLRIELYVYNYVTFLIYSTVAEVLVDRPEKHNPHGTKALQNKFLRLGMRKS